MPQIPIAQGTIVPSLYVGLGGTGSRIVDRIAQRAKGLPHWESHLSPLTHFIGIDTSSSDQKELLHIPEGNRILISAFDRQRAVKNYREAGDDKALQWLDKNYTPRAGNVDGAGQIRVESRLSFHYNSPGIRKRLEEIVRHALSAENSFRQIAPANFFVYLYCGLGGGTGSGSFLPMSYLIQSVIRDQNWEPRVVGYFALSTLMTGKVSASLHPNIHANTYGALKELEHLTKLDYAAIKVERPKGEEFVFWNNANSRELPFVETRPFHIGFIVDKSERLELPDLDTTIADASFLQTFSPAYGRVSAELDNYDQHLQDLTRLPGELKNIGRGYTKHFAAFGVATLVLPASELLEYCALRFAAEALRQQVTFGSSKGTSAVDAKLASVRVNYDDDKFARKSQADKEAEINGSFVQSMQIMAAEDVKDDLPDGIWNRLVEDVDKGKLTGQDEKGTEKRTETLQQKVIRLLDEERKAVLTDVAIRPVNLFAVNLDSLGAYNDQLSKFETDVALANRKVSEKKQSLKASALQGDCIEALNPLGPLQKRYLIIRLMEQVETNLLPDAKTKREGSLAKSYENPKAQEAFRKDKPETLAAAAAGRILGHFPSRVAFEATRDQVQQDFSDTGKAQKDFYDADLRFTQYTALLEYLRSRSRQYAGLASAMNSVVGTLDSEAERIRLGIAVDQPRFALSVEVFETMDAPKMRLWAEVFEELFIKNGRGQKTFDRTRLAKVIGDQLQPVVQAGTGKVVMKEDTVLEKDLTRALIQLGRDMLRPAIFGDEHQRGLTVETGIELEAALVLRLDSAPIASVREDDIAGYVNRKLTAFNLLTGVYARIARVDSATKDDGVLIADTRNIIIETTAMTPAFLSKIERQVLRDGRAPRLEPWGAVPNQHLVFAHDMDLPIPLYYFLPVVNELEASYEKVLANPRRVANLHTDYHWEMALPNLNPNRDTVSTGWAVNTLLEGILYRLIKMKDGQWTWPAQDKVLGNNLSSALYLLSEFHTSDDLHRIFDANLEQAKDVVDAADLNERTRKFMEQADQFLTDIALSGHSGGLTREMSLEQPIWAMFRQRLSERLKSKQESLKTKNNFESQTRNFEI